MQIPNYSQKRKYLQVIEWVIFFLLIGLCDLYETSGSGLKPLILLPLSLCISSHTEELQAMAVGAVCGFQLDLACGKLPGFNAILLVLFCVTSSLLYHYLLKQKLVNMLILTSVFSLIQGGLDYIFYYAIWGHENVFLIWENVISRSCVMTIISAIPCYFIIHGVSEKCGGVHRTDTLEKTKISYPE